MTKKLPPDGFDMSLAEAITLAQKKGIALSNWELGKILNEKPEGPLKVRQWRHGTTLRTRFNRDNLIQYIDWFKAQQSGEKQ
jgi:hypothetical protein